MKAESTEEVLRELLRYCNNHAISCGFILNAVSLEIAMSSAWCDMSEDDPE